MPSRKKEFRRENKTWKKIFWLAHMEEAQPQLLLPHDFSLVSAERENSYFNLEILLFLLLNLILHVPVSSEARVPKH